MNAFQTVKSVLNFCDLHLRALDRGRLSHRLGIPYRSVVNVRIDQANLMAQVSELFALSPAIIQSYYTAYKGLHYQQRYAQVLGEYKTLSFEEAFILFVTLIVARPKSIVQIGTKQGKSTRKLIDMSGLLNLNARIRCFDVANQVKYFQPGEARLLIDDVTGAFRQKVLETYRPQLILLDAHPYPLLREVISETIQRLDQCTLVIHDCGWGLCNPKLSIPRDRSELISSANGYWERHILAESFHVSDPLDPRLDDLRQDNLRLRIFETTHGLAIIRKQK